MDIVPHMFHKIGLAGLVALWMVKASLGYVVFRFWKTKRADKSKGMGA